MPEQKVLSKADLPEGAKKTVKINDTEILLIHHEGQVLGLQAKCPHANAPLEKGAVCKGHLVCPWHMGTFALPGGELLEPPPLHGLKTYPVRIDGDDIYATDEAIQAPQIQAPKKAANQKDDRTFLLVGAGAAGLMAATTLRSEGFAGRIVAVDPVTDEPADRTQLTKQALSGKMPLEKVPIGFKEADQQKPVELVADSVTYLDSAAKQVKLAGGKTIHFDAALVATGGKPKRLDVPGAELAHTLRHIDDVRGIFALAEEKKKNNAPVTAVIIGTSFIGLEAASALTQYGLNVTVIGPEILPFAKKFGDQVAEALKSFHQEKGTHFRLGVDVLSITPEGVHARDSKSKKELGLIPADIVLFGVGVAPELSFQHTLPLAEKGGIAVSSGLRAADSIWVAGDIASVNGTRIEHWRLAEQHGQLAARNMLGHNLSYDSVPFFWTTHYDKRLGYLGHADDWDVIIYDGAVDALTFIAYSVKDGKVAAILSCGRDTDTARLAEAMRTHPTLEQARIAIAH